MQTIEFLSTAKWIGGQITSEMESAIFEAGPHFARSGLEQASVQNLFRPLHDLTLVIEQLRTYPLAAKVLRAFQLDEFLDREFPVMLTQRLISAEKQRDPRELDEYIIKTRQLWANWQAFKRCIAPLENLTIPQQVIQESDFDEILTIILQYQDSLKPTAATVAQILSSTTELYASIATLTGDREFPPLRVIYFDSGSSIRFDLKGLGDPIKRVKELLVEAWNLVRYREVEDYRRNNRAILEGLKTVREIESLRDRNELPEEDALRLRKLILDGATTLLDNGALPREAMKVEIIENVRILDEFQQKLLPAAPKEQLHRKNKRGTSGSKKGRAKAAPKSKKR